MYEDRIKHNMLVSLIIMLALSCCAGQPRFRVIAEIDVASLNLRSVLGEGNGAFSVLDSNRIVLGQGNELVIVKDGLVEKTIRAPIQVSTFDINKKGNGVIIWNKYDRTKKLDANVYDTYFLRVRRFQIDSTPTRLDLPGAGRASSVLGADMMNDSIVRIIQNEPDFLVLTNIDSLAKYQFVVLADSLSRFISKGGYIGSFGSEHYFLDANFRPQGAFSAVLAFRMAKGRPEDERIFELGDLGRGIPLSTSIRYDAESGLFYLMRVQQEKLVIREFRISDFSDKR